VLAEEEARKKRQKMVQNENIASLFSPNDQDKHRGKKNDFMSRGFTISRPQK